MTSRPMGAATCLVLAALAILSASGAATSEPEVALGRKVHGSVPSTPPGAEFAFRFASAAEGPVAIHATSLDLDVRLRVIGPDGTSVASDDNGGVGTDSRIMLAVRRDVAYRIFVGGSPEDGGGEFDLSVLAPDQDPVPPKDDPEPRIAYWESVEKRAREQHREFRRTTALLGRGRALVDQGSFDEATALGQDALRIREQMFGPDHASVGRALDLLGYFRFAAGDYAGAKKFYDRALPIQEARLGPEHPDLAETLTDLGGLLSTTADYPGALRAFERALAMIEKTKGRDSLEAADAANNVGGVYDSMGKIPEARALYERALATRERILGPDSVEVAECLNNLAGLAEMEGDYETAREQYQRALPILRGALGPGHDFTCRLLSNLGNVLSDLGDYAGARALYEDALTNLERLLGPDHPSVAVVRTNLAQALMDMGAYPDALPLYESALAQRRRALGESHPDVGQAINNLAVIHHRMRHYDKAIELLHKAIPIYEASLGPDDRSVAGPVGSLGIALHDVGRYAEAKPYLERALAIREKALTPQHPATAQAMTNLAIDLRDSGQTTEARALFERALAIYESSVGPDHPDTSDTRLQMAKLLARIGDRDAALRQSLLGVAAERDHLRRTAGVLPERLALAAGSHHANELAIAVAAASGTNGEAARKVFDAVVRSRALVLDEMTSRSRFVRERADPIVRPLVDRLRRAQQDLSDLSVRGPGERPPDVYHADLERARVQVDGAEEALAQASASFRTELHQDGAGLNEVASALPDGSAIVAYTRATEMASTEDATPSYVALVLRAGAKLPAIVPVGKGDVVDEAVAEWRRRILAGVTDGAGDEAIRSAGERLRDLIWTPVAPLVAGAKLVFVVPEGSLHLVNIAALPDGQSGYLVDTALRVQYLSAERDLVAPRAPEKSGEGLLAMGGPSYDDANAGAPPRAQFRGSPPACSDFSAYRFPALPASSNEVREVARIWKRTPIQGGSGEQRVTTLTGLEATETAFKTLAPGRRIVHLATHGFFLGGMCSEAVVGSRGLGSLVPQSAGANRSQPAPPPRNPMTFSGLALAGANRRASASPDHDDGILTAEEIASLDLSGVEWAVLSACDTGLGDIRAGEGVLGLRRAFEVAGVRTMILSLWPVGDETTRAWMDALYSARLEQGKNSVDAVRSASRSVLEARRRSKQSTNPLFWGAFVAAGDWR